MPSTIDIPEGLPDRDAQRIKRVNRNIRIRQEYRRLRPEYGWERASEIVAQQYRVSKSTVRKVIKGLR